jgi:hypothetical protein
MSTVAEIKAAIDQLSPQERRELEALLHPWTEDDWDRRMAADSEAGGKLHQMMTASRQNAQAGELLRQIPAGRHSRKQARSIVRSALRRVRDEASRH